MLAVNDVVRDYDAEMTGIEHRLHDAVRTWLREAWPFTNVAFPGRDTS